MLLLLFLLLLPLLIIHVSIMISSSSSSNNSSCFGECQASLYLMGPEARIGPICHWSAPAGAAVYQDALQSAPYQCLLDHHVAGKALHLKMAARHSQRTRESELIQPAQNGKGSPQCT